MTTYLVTRHEGTRIWAEAAVKQKRLPFAIDEVLDHLDPKQLKRGDRVIGTLPLHLIAELGRRGVEFWSIDLDVPPAQRGQELTGVQLYKLGASLARYKVRQEEQISVEPKAARAKTPGPAISLIPVSDQLAPAAIGWLHHPTAEVWLLASPRMKDNARGLQRWMGARERAPRVEVLSWDDTDYARLLEQADDWAKKLVAEDRPEVNVHLTGGTKPMSMALQRAFGKRRSSFGDALTGPYVDTGHGRIEDLLSETVTATPMRSVLNIRDLLALQGIEAGKAKSTDPDYGRTINRRRLFSLLRGEGAKSWLSAWYALLEPADWLLDPRRNKKGSRDYSNDFVNVKLTGKSALPTFNISIRNPKRHYWVGLRRALKGKFGSVLRECGAANVVLDEKDENTLTLSLERDELPFLLGGWMEVWLASVFAQAGVDDWVQGLEVSQARVPNEFDVLVANGNRLLLIEVKTAQLDRDGKSDSKATEVVYKLDSLAEKLGPQFSDRWLVSLRPLGNADRERAEAHKIRVFDGPSLATIHEEIRGWVAKRRLPRDSSFQPAFAPKR